MATKTAEKIEGDAGSFVLVWTLEQGDVAAPVPYVGAADRTVFIKGDLAGATLDIEGSVNPAPVGDEDYGILDDSFENPLTFSDVSTKPQSIAQLVSKLRPKLTGGTVDTLVYVYLLVKGTNR